MVDHYREVHQRLESDPEFISFFSGETTRPPAYYVKRIQVAIGPLFAHLPPKVLDYFRSGEAAPNPRMSLGAHAPPSPASLGAPSERVS